MATRYRTCATCPWLRDRWACRVADHFQHCPWRSTGSAAWNAKNLGLLSRFVIKPHSTDALCDLLELKLPHAKLVVGCSNRWRLWFCGLHLPKAQVKMLAEASTQNGMFCTRRLGGTGNMGDVPNGGTARRGLSLLVDRQDWQAPQKTQKARGGGRSTLVSCHLTRSRISEAPWARSLTG
jgi:hypothetical protein